MKNLNISILVTATLLASMSIANASVYKLSRHVSVSHVHHLKQKEPATGCIQCEECPDPTKCQVAKHHRRHHSIVGKASWYGNRWHGRRTASGERFNQYAFTTAHKTLPFGTKLKITNVNNNKSVIVVVNDRGPYVRGRVFDLSKAAAAEIGITGVGVISAEVLS